MIVAVLLIGSQMATFGSRSIPWVTPVLVMLLGMGIISAGVACIPRCQTNCGRYLVFGWWFACVTWIWNIIWWFLLFSTIDGTSIPQWQCEANPELDKATQAFEDCKDDFRMSTFYQGLVMFCVDLWASFELFMWAKNEQKKEQNEIP